MVSAMPDVEQVAALAGDPHNTGLPIASSPEGFDLIVSDGDFHLASSLARLPLVIPAGSGPAQSQIVTDCSLRGLALALAVRSSARLAAYTIEGRAVASGRSFSFPPPLGELKATRVSPVAGVEVWEAPHTGGWAGCRVENKEVLAWVDDVRFAAAIALAAGVAIAKDLPVGVWSPWDRAEAYLQAATAAGLVVATL